MSTAPAIPRSPSQWVKSTTTSGRPRKQRAANHHYTERACLTRQTLNYLRKLSAATDNAATWKAYGGDQYAPSADKATREQQIAVAEKVKADRGGYSAWPACSRKLGLS